MIIKEKETGISNINDFLVLLEIGEATRLMKEHWELIPAFWNYYLRENKYSEMCDIIYACNIQDKEYIDDMIELLSHSNSRYNSFEIAYMSTGIVEVIRYIPEGLKKLILQECGNIRIMYYILSYGDESFIIEAKRKMLLNHPENLDTLINYMNRYNDGYTINDFYKDLPQDYQVSVII